MINEINKAFNQIQKDLAGWSMIIFWNPKSKRNQLPRSLSTNKKQLLYTEITSRASALVEFSDNEQTFYSNYSHYARKQNNYPEDLAESRQKYLLYALTEIMVKIHDEKKNIADLFMLSFWNFFKEEIAGIALTYIMDYVLLDLVNQKVHFEQRRCIRDFTGFIYNPNIDDKKTLTFFKEGIENKYLKKCQNCGKWEFRAYEAQSEYEANGTLKLKEISFNGMKKLFCKRCLEERNLGKCEICGKDHFRDTYNLSPEMARTLGKRSGADLKICSSCFDQKFIRCINCNEIIARTTYNANGGFCNKCKHGKIHDWNYKSTPKFKKLAIDDKTHNELYFGLEIELECNCPRRTDISSIVNKRLGNFAYCKNDGSLKNGFEIVTEPLSYNFFLKKSSHFQSVMEEITNKGAYSYKAQNTGVHIHISRAAFKTKEHLAKFASCFYLQKEYTEFIAWRQFGSYCKYDSDYRNYKTYTERLGSDLSGNVDSDRYNAINFNNRNTVEVRIFKGNLKTKTILMYIQFCLAIYQYTEKLALDKKPKIEELKEFIMQYKKGYEYLKARTAAFEVSEHGSMSMGEKKKS